MSTTFLLLHVREEDGDEVDFKLVGAFSTREKAEAAIRELCDQPGFRDHLSGFSVDEYTIDKIHWRKGFGIE